MAVTLSPTPSFRRAMMLTGSTGSTCWTPHLSLSWAGFRRFLSGGDCHGINARVYQRPQRTWQNEMRGETEHHTGLTSQPAARMSGFANAWVNSGCGTVAADWTQRQSAAEL